MGLDWIPGPKAKPGYEQEFLALWEKLHAKSCFWRDSKLKRFQEITTTGFETLAAPRVGFDASATEWARRAFHQRKDKCLNEQQFLERMQGYYVLDLVPPCDGIPRYSNGPLGTVDRYSFRGEYLRDCQDILGQDLVKSAWNSKLSEETAEYGRELLGRATAYATAHGIDISKVHLAEPDSAEFNVDVVLAAGKWCRFWAERGHWLEAWF